MQTPVLYRLPDSTWIKLTDVTSIRTYPVGHFYSGTTKPLSPPSVYVDRGANSIVLEFETYTDAQNYADELAAAVNAAPAQTVTVSDKSKSE